MCRTRSLAQVYFGTNKSFMSFGIKTAVVFLSFSCFLYIHTAVRYDARIVSYVQTLRLGVLHTLPLAKTLSRSQRHVRHTRVVSGFSELFALVLCSRTLLFLPDTSCAKYKYYCGTKFMALPYSIHRWMADVHSCE